MAIKIYQRRVATADAPRVRQNLKARPEEFGAGVGLALQGVARAAGAVQTVAEASEKARLQTEFAEREKADATAIQEAYVQASEARLRHEKQLAGTHGRNAIEWGAKAPSELNRELDKIGETLLPRQREQFAMIRDREILGFRGRVNSHTVREGEQLFQQSNAASRAVAVEKAAGSANAGSRVGILMARDDMIAATDAAAKHGGMDPVAAKAFRKQELTKLHSAVVGELFGEDRNDWQGARDYIEAHKDEIDLDEMKRLEQGVKVAKVRETTIRKADELFQKHVQGQWGFDSAKASAAVRGIKDVDLRLAVEKRLREMVNQREADRRVNDAEPLGRLHERILMGRGLDTHSEDWLRLSDQGQATARAWMRSKRQEGKRQQNELDQFLWYGYMRRSPHERGELDIDDALKDASPRLKARARADQDAVARRSGVELGDFNRRVETIVQDFDKTDAEAYTTLMNEKFSMWRSAPENQDKKGPPDDQVAAWLADSMRVAEERWYGDTRQWEEEYDRLLEARDAADDEEMAGPPAGPEGTSPSEPVGPASSGPVWPAVLRWETELAAVATLDDIKDPTIVAGIVADYRRARPGKGDPTPDQIVAYFNKMQRKPRQ